MGDARVEELQRHFGLLGREWWGAGLGLGPLFRPGAGSRSSLGRRILGRGSEAVRGRFPLGGGNDEEGGREWRRDGGGCGGGSGAGCNDGAVLGEIPAASAGMTEEVRRV